MNNVITKIIRYLSIAIGAIGLAYVGYYLYFNRYWFLSEMSETHGANQPWDLYIRPLVVLVPSLLLLWLGFKSIQIKSTKMTEEQKRQLVEQWTEPPASSANIPENPQPQPNPSTTDINTTPQPQ